MLFRLIALLALVASITWLVRRILPAGARLPRKGYAFTIEYAEGRQRRVRGVVPRPVFNAFEDVASLTRLDGTVSAQRDGRLEFSPGVSEGVRQQFENAWWASKHA
jgi:hypothetical protein